MSPLESQIVSLSGVQAQGDVRLRHPEECRGLLARGEDPQQLPGDQVQHLHSLGLRLVAGADVGLNDRGEVGEHAPRWDRRVDELRWIRCRSRVSEAL